MLYEVITYICGEETALIESLEGKRGEPRNRPPYPVDTGFMNNPTIVNNVETFLNVTLICEKGVEFFKEYGTSRSTGTKFFSVSGDIEKAGIYELPFGITIAQLMKEVGCRDAKARITSYNVCYTKLLRIAIVILRRLSRT